MSYRKACFDIHNIFSQPSRERCLERLKQLVVPKFGISPSDKAAVLVPLCRVDDVASILYTVRSSDQRSYSREISFPGGKAEKNESPVDTALRETEEEIGLSRQKIEVWGHGPPVPGRNNKVLITPVIGAIANLSQEDLNINNKEVEEAFTVPIEILCNPKNQFHTQFKNGFILPVFVAEQYKIWGITAYITHAFLSSVLTKEFYKNDWTKKKIDINNKETPNKIF